MAPVLEIVLDHKPPLPGLPGSKNELYIAGDTVAGYVKVNVAPEAVRSLSIEFAGILSVAVHNAQQNNNLFSFSLKPTPNTEGKCYFAFKLPGTVVVAPDESMAPRHVPIAPQSLLPSFSYGYTADKQHGDIAAKVEYQVLVKIEHKGTIFTKRDSEIKKINISAAPLDGISLLSASPASQIFTLQSPRLNPGLEHYRPTAMERFSSFLGNVTQGLQDPKIIVDLRADLPNSLALGYTMPSTISINLLPDSLGIDTPPRIYVLKVEAKLQIITEFAVQTSSKRKMLTMDLCSKKWDSKTLLLDYGYQHKMDITEWLSENFILDRFGPTTGFRGRSAIANAIANANSNDNANADADATTNANNLDANNSDINIDINSQVTNNRGEVWTPAKCSSGRRAFYRRSS
ncbi:hypothetical protein ABW20_dc0105937 [Dactylellina cionopaga]|nr:hypothetical protein ABW20_dc0105937 [Dactylellina cionopaga]